MDNNYEQQFAQSIQAAPAPVGTTSNSKLPLIIAAILAAITLIESIALVISLTNQSNLATEEETAEAIVDDTDYNASDYVYDNEDNLTAIKLKCTAENGAYFQLDTDRNYQQYDASGQAVGSGTYSILRDSIVSLSSSNGGNSEHVLFYDGIILADGTTVYDCTTTEAVEDTESVTE